MTPQRQRSREAIRSEMLQEVARLWNNDESEIALESFDPLVGLLLGAFATGIEGIHHELQSSRSRIVERLAGLLTPDVMTGPQPAHAVMRTNIIDPTFIIQPTHLFSCSVGGKDFHFSPAGSFKLVNARLKTVVVQNKVKEYSTTVKESYLNEVLPYNTLWLGIALDPEVEHLRDFTLFFDWRNDPMRSTNLSHIAAARVYLNGTEIKSSSGLPEIDQNSQFLGESGFSGQLHRNVQKWYGRHFITIDNVAARTGIPIRLADCSQRCPEEISIRLAPEELAKHFIQELFWLKVVFPESLPAEATYRTHIDVNAFPVVNRKLCSDTHELRTLFNVFPIRVETNESFLEMASVETPSTVKLKEAQQLNRHEQSRYVLRQGGVSRFDERDGYDLVTYLITLLRDESAMFMALGRSELESEIEEIRKRLEKIYTAIGEDRGQNSFITVKTTEKSGRLTVSFWSTKAEQANKVPFGTKLSKDRTQLVFTDEDTVLLTTTTGGANKLSPNENLPAFRQALLTRGRVVTVEDIKAVCFAELGNQLSKVTVTKGFDSGLQKTQGLMRTMDVVLTPNSTQLVAAEQWDEHCYRIKHALEQQSACILPYRVFISQ